MHRNGCLLGAVQFSPIRHWLHDESHTLTYVTDDFARVKLQESEGVEGSDYVNASYIDVRIIL